MGALEVALPLGTRVSFTSPMELSVIGRMITQGTGDRQRRHTHPLSSQQTVDRI